MKRFITLIFAAVFCFSAAILTLAEDIGVSAQSAVLIDADSKKILYSKNCNARMPMASTTKIMTALVAIENCDINQQVIVSPKAVGVEGSSVCLKAGEELTMEELLYAMLLESANDAAAAIAIEVGGSIEGFAEMMNAKAKELGLENTSFTNPHGLDNENHYTTAKELAIIGATALENPVFAKISSTYKHQIPYDGSSHRYLMNHNKMLRIYDGAIGIKTGFTKRSGRCLVSAAKRDGMTLVGVTLNAPNDWNDHKAMLDYGFENFEMKTVVKENEYNFKLSCIGSETGEISVTNTQSVSKCLPANSKQGVSIQILLPRFVYAPIKENQKIGELVLSDADGEFARIDLISITAAERTEYKKKLLWF